jgi:Ser/Thr protein kinase RdoA (MazF antagonist)
MDEISLICQKFFPNKIGLQSQRISGGLINSTFKISFDDGETFILQAINQSVFGDPFVLMNNIQIIANHLKKSGYPLKVLEPISSANGLIEKDSFGNYWRTFPFFENTSVFEKVTNSEQAFEAAKSFGLFIKYLEGIDLKRIKETIPNFHNLSYRLQHFDLAVKEGLSNRIEKAKEEIKNITNWRDQLNFDFKNMPLRLVHNDTKISNVLLDEIEIKGVSVIDLDTVMPGYLITDFGDMIRTMCCSGSEEETNLDKVEIDLEIFKAVANGFLNVTNSMLTKEEKKNLIIGGIYIIFEQAIRFLTDYLQGDKYYPVQFADQNLFRAKNQIKLLQSLLEKKSEMELIISELF